MCYYDQVIYTCNCWKWDNFRQHCDREYRMGETCGLKLVNGNSYETDPCKICNKIATKYRRREAEANKYARWSRENRLQELYASAEKCLETIAGLDREIINLVADRDARRNGNMPSNSARRGS